jgi:UDP-N-acetylmuramoylalanine--D-glutamate ligase
VINLDFLKGKNIVVFGLGKAGMASVKSLSNGGAFITASDDSKDSMLALDSQKIANVKIEYYNLINWNIVDILVLSPGVPFTHPKPHPVVIAAQKENCPVICDIELLYLANKKANFIGITGTNGKSTTTALTGHILKNSGTKTQVGGNIGIPALNLENLSDDGNYVIEMSSYQLDLVTQTKFNIAVWLNITPDHIDRHGDIEGYIKAKKRIFQNQGKDDVAVIGVDDVFSENVYNDLKKQAKISHIIPVSVDKILPDGVSIINGVNGVLVDNIDKKIEIKLGELKKLQGKHNAQNIAMAYVACKYSGVDSENFLKGVRSFDGLPHRMQYITEKNGVLYINDSKATNAEAASKALGTFKNIYWIAGGVSKAGGIEPLQEYFPKIKHAYLIGAAQDEFATTLDGKVLYSKCGDLKNAFMKAKKDAENSGENNSVVLLSPACASFDQWSNFEVRGSAFVGYVNE